MKDFENLEFYLMAKKLFAFISSVPMKTGSNAIYVSYAECLKNRCSIPEEICKFLNSGVVFGRTDLFSIQTAGVAVKPSVLPAVRFFIESKVSELQSKDFTFQLSIWEKIAVIASFFTSLSALIISIISLCK